MQITKLAPSCGTFTTYDLWPAKCSQSGPQHESNIPRNPGVDGSSPPQIFAIPDENSIQLSPYPISALATFDNHPVDGKLLGRQVLYGDVGSDSEFIQLLGVLVMSTSRFFDVPIALLSSIVFTPLPHRVK